jgi:hypothetical protein
VIEYCTSCGKLVKVSPSGLCCGCGTGYFLVEVDPDTGMTIGLNEEKKVMEPLK